MRVELVDLNTNQQICIADIIFGLDTFIIDNVEGIEKLQLEALLQEKIYIEESYEVREEFIKALGMEHRRNAVIREKEAYVLYCMLHDFKSDKDSLALYPLKDELFTMFMHNPDYSNLYLWEARRNDTYA